MLINQSNVKKYVHERGKRLSKEGLDTVNRVVAVILDGAITLSRSVKTIQPFEIMYGVKKSNG